MAVIPELYVLGAHISLGICLHSSLIGGTYILTMERIFSDMCSGERTCISLGICVRWHTFPGGTHINHCNSVLVEAIFKIIGC